MRPSVRAGGRISAVLLDCGGTLLKSIDSDPDSLFFDLLKAENVPVTRSSLRGSSEYFRMYWHDKYSHLPRGERWTPEIRALCDEAVLEHYKVECNRPQVARRISARFESAFHPSLFPDVQPTLEALRTLDLKLGVVSQSLNSSAELKQELDKWGIGRYFAMVLTSESAGIDKPDPAIYREAAARIRAPVDEVCHVGNSLVNDALSAQRAGMRGVLVDRGGTEIHPEGLLVISSLTELPAAL